MGLKNLQKSLVENLAKNSKTSRMFSFKIAQLSVFTLDLLETKNVHIIEALIWTAMLTLIVSRRIYSLVKNSIASPNKKNRYTQSRWSKIFAEKAADLLTVILHRCEIQRNFETTISAYKRQALDPHVKRERFREEWFE